ncbi:MAG: iron-containing alcohol dehydrogenase [Clostridia bacterium]|nr:iron-containing alcohol dehydrogenase [Clostridia bacterium]
MYSLFFPHEVYCGIDSLDKIFSKDYSQVLIISDSEPFAVFSAAQQIHSSFNSILTEAQLITSQNPENLFKQAYAYANKEMPECVIAVGSGFVQDCAAAVSRITETPYISVVSTAPTHLYEYNTLDVFLYKKMPDICILDPVFITNADSLSLAYDALGMMTLALEAAICADERFVIALAQKAFIEIYRNIMPAFRGEISARENLCGAMYGAYTAYVNSGNYSWESAAYRTASFFSDFSGSKLRVLAVCIPYLSEHYCEIKPQSFARLAMFAEPDAQKEIAAQMLLKNIRRIQATLAFPSSMKNYSVKETDFLVFSESLSVEEKDFYFQCYYGNVNFVKKDTINSLLD